MTFEPPREPPALTGPAPARHAVEPYAGAGGLGWPGDRTAPDEREGLDWRRYLAAIRRYKWFVLVIAVLGSAGGVVASRFVRPTYVAQATVWVPEQVRDNRGPIQQEALFGSFGWTELLKTSFVVLDDVVRDLRLYLRTESGDSAALVTFGIKERFMPGRYRLDVDGDGRTFQLRGATGAVLQQGTLGDSIGAEFGLAWVPPAGSLGPGRSMEFEVLPPRDAALRLQQDLQARIAERGANFLSLRLEGSDPQALARIVNQIADGFVDTARSLANSKHRELISALEAQLDSAETRLHNADMALEAFRVQTITEPTERGSPVPGGIQETRNPVIANFIDMRLDLDGLRHDRDAIERALAAADTGLTPDALMFIPSVQSSVELSKVLAHLTERQAELAALGLRYTPEHPEVLRAVRQIAELQRRTIPDLARGLLAQMTLRERELDTRIGSGARELRLIPRRATEEQRLTREVAIAEQAYETLKARHQDARFAESAGTLGARVLDRAAVPQAPIRDTAMRLVAMTLMASLGVALLGAIVLDRLDRRFRYPDQVQADLGLTILGAIPRVRAQNGAGNGDRNAAQIVEAFRGVRLGVTHAHGASGPLLLTVSSPGPGEGKSFVASNLALTFADGGHRTLLIDADLRRGDLHRVLGVSRKPGLTDFLQGKVALEAILQATSYPSLQFIGGGTRTHGAPELLGSETLQGLLLGLRSQFDVILLDSPPLGAGVDAFLLGTAAGCLLLVLRTGRTDRELAEAKLDVLDRLPIRVLGAVLNDIRPADGYRYYGYSYYLEGYEVRSEADDEKPALLKG